MPRAVGDSRTYPVSLLNSRGEPIGKPFEVPSVTTILKALPKELSWWGYRIGLREGRRLASIEGYDSLDEPGFYEEVKRLAREESAAETPQNTLSKAGDRGTTVHDIAEQVFRDDVWPDPKLVPEELHGYIKGMKRWHDARIRGKGYEVVAVEVNLLSMEHGFAGTCDLILHDPQADMYFVIDFKTSKAIYESHLLQIAAYKHAAIEQGYIPVGPLVNGMVVRFSEDGKYATKGSECSIEDFLKVKEVWHWLCSMGWTG